MGSYPKLFTLGHRSIESIFLDEVEVEEKVDGSQFTWGKLNGELVCFSKNCKIYPDSVPSLFRGAVDTAARLFEAGLLTEGTLYRGEALQSPKHNTLCYTRAPKGNVILFDVMSGPENYITHALKCEYAQAFDIEVVPLIFKGRITSQAQIELMMDRISILGGQKIEGLVFKNYGRFGIDGKPLFGKWVSEEFKEVHHGEWKKSNPGKQEIIDTLTNCYATPARWTKAVQHLRDAGKLTDSPKDIGPLMGACAQDIHAECADEIKEKLFKWAWPLLARRVNSGIPIWYKQELMKAQPYEEVA